MSLRRRLICLCVTCGALGAFAAAPAMATITPLTITGTSGGVTISNSAVNTTVWGTPDPGPLTFTAHTAFPGDPVRVVGQESWTCEDVFGLHYHTGTFDSSYEIGGFSSITFQPSQCPTGQTSVYHEVNAQAEETYQYYVFGQGFRTGTATTGNVEFLWVFPQ